MGNGNESTEAQAQAQAKAEEAVLITKAWQKPVGESFHCELSVGGNNDRNLPGHLWEYHPLLSVLVLGVPGWWVRLYWT